MFLLYNGNETGSPEARLIKKIHDVQWELVKRHSVRILRSLPHDGNAADTLETMPFELWEATNGFGDQFEVLYMKVPVAKYVEVELEADTYLSKARYESIARALAEAGNSIRFVGMDAEIEHSATIPTPLLQTTSVAVSRALSDFEVLVSSKGGPVSGVDRIHTALHGYLKAICKDASIIHSDDANTTTLFRLIRDKHPRFHLHPPAVDGANILRGLARIVDALNPVRNQHSMAHPTDELMEEPEALLAVNAVKSLLHYLNAKLR